MSRYAKANQTIEDLASKIEDAGGLHEIIYSDRVYDDLHKINVDFENVESFDDEDAYTHLSGLEDMVGYEMIGEGETAFPVLWCAGGGDWEFPLVFVLYIGQKGEMRGYIPEDGNVYNYEKKAAYGNNDEDPIYEDDPEDPTFQFNMSKMKSDVYNRIVAKPLNP